MEKTCIVSAKAASNAKRFGIMAMVWTLIAFVALLTYGILQWTNTEASASGRNTLLAIGITTTLTASIFAGVAVFTTKPECNTTDSKSDDKND
jgi:cell division protein FtsW (lipid II flippase)